MFKGSRPRRAARFLPRSARAPAVEAARWTVEKLVGQFASKEMLLPEMQRGYVWTPEKARALIDSLYKDYPSGSMLLWEARPWTRGPDGRGDGGAYLLLDGQQRLTSLYAIITGAPVRTRRGGAVQESRIEVFFNMDHPDFPIDPDTEEADDRSGHSVFRLKSPAVAGSPRWIDVTRLFREGESAVLAEKAEPGDPNRQKYLERLSALRNRLTTYFYPVQILDRDMPYAQVADVFVRVNSHGSGTRKSDLALAQVTSRWRGSMGLFARLSEECSEKGYDLDEGFVLKCLMSVAAGKSGLGGVGSTPINQIRESWEKTRASLLFAIGFLKNAGVETAEILPAKLPIIPMVCMAAKHDCRFPSSMERPITRWFYAAVMRGRYSGGSAALDEDLGLIKNCERPVERMVENIRLQSGKLEIEGGDLAGSAAKSPFLCMMYVLARNADARDWNSGRPIGAGGGLQYVRVFDHGALRASLEEKHGAERVRWLWSDVANTVFADGRGGLGRLKPEERLKGVAQIAGEDALDAQCVPTDPALWRPERYEDFLLHRRRAIASSINDLMGSLEGP